MSNRAETGVWVSLIAYLLLSTTKVGLGYWLSSQALTADGLNNVTDVLAAGGVLIGLRIARKPRDEDHPYGHSRAESISALIASFIMATIGLEVLQSGIRTAWKGTASPPDLWAAWIALGCAGVMFAVFGYTRHLAHRTRSSALSAVSKDNLSDAMVSIGAAAGIIGSQWGMPWLDAAAAIIVGLIILKTAWGIFKEMSHLLTDGFHEGELSRYRDTMEEVKGVKSVVDLKGRMQGNEVILDAVIEVDRELTVEESHRITELLEAEMARRHQVRQTHIHVEPDGSPDSSSDH
ncbi:cation diffusion facilitator family transporter [Kroppenstedtia eburnea]|uniref:cation diffusion facilitator family transporter n=1 Tax=Kroppenstedtia eburnea TaxID=714067 RepID=UPI0036254D29